MNTQMPNTSNNDIIVGLAGHIDHGKTSLIRALNGFDGDSLEEEKKRGITLDLSFSHLNLSSRNVAFIDVPGHEKLVKNMIAGAFGFDILLLVVASDDGLMPQSFEHLQIADMLGIKHCICVLSKVDKASSELVQRRKKEITQAFKDLHIRLEGIFEFSIFDSNNKPYPQPTPNTHNPNPYTNDIIEFLRSYQKPQRHDFGMVVYYIDRVFSISGAGCVCTGTLASGSIKNGDSVFVCELQKELIVRSLQIHDTPQEIASPSHRVALNLANIQADELKRGFLISQKGFIRGSCYIDVKLRPFNANNLASNTTYQLYIGTKRISVKLNILESKQSETFAQLSSKTPIFSLFQQHIIIRDGNESIAGGIVLNPISDPIKRKQKISLLHALDSHNFIQAFEILAKIHKKGFGVVSSTQRFGLSHTQAIGIMEELQSTKESIFFDKRDLVAYPISQLEYLKNEILNVFSKNKNALLSAKSLQIKHKWASIEFLQKALDELVAEKFIKKQESLYLVKNNEIHNIKDFLQKEILHILQHQKFTPPAPYNIYDSLDIDRATGDSALKALSKSQKVVRIAHNLFIESNALNEVINTMRQILNTNGYIDITLLKEKLPLSRKYLINYLEYLDNFNDIVREGDKRISRFNAKN
ncbi:selenocysteine-specific translation elongation factor [Helicobacter sp. 23-1046]